MKTINTKTLEFLYKEPDTKTVSKTVFFFSLSAKHSLTLPPFCHPVDSLLKKGVRVVSITLPSHENEERPYGIQEIWAEQTDVLEGFIHNLAEGVKELTNHFPPPYGAMGISRGAFIALHLASLVKDVTSISCFAPMLSILEREELAISPLVKTLKDKNIHFFVGHHDTLIGTENVVSLSQKLIDKNEKASIYMKMYPSIGRGGHGTPNEIFEEGASWLNNIL